MLVRIIPIYSINLLLFILCLLLISTGCSTVRYKSEYNFKGLNNEEETFARAMAYFARGLIYEKEFGRYSDKAKEMFKKAAEADPKTHMLHFRVAFNETNSDKAIEALERSCKANPSSLQARIDLAMAYYVTKDFDSAIKQCSTIIKLNPEDTSTYSMLAELLFLQKKDYRAIKVLNKGIKSTDNSTILLTLCFTEGSKFFRNGELQRALLCFNFISKQIPNNSLIFAILGDIYIRDKNFKKAISSYEKIIKIVEKSDTEKLTANFYLNYGGVCEQAGYEKKAEAIFKECLNIYPDNHSVLNYMAYMWAEKNKNIDKALEYIIKALKQSPGNGAYEDTMGWIYFKQGKLDKAIEHIQKANNLIKNDPVISEHLGDIFEAKGDMDKTIFYWEKSFKLNPKNKDVLKKLRSHKINTDELIKEIKK